MENKRYQNIFKTAPFGFALREIILDGKGKPCDYIFLDTNDKFAEFTGLNIADIIGKKHSELFLKTENEIFDWIGFYGKVALNGGQDKTEQYSKIADKWFKVEVTSTDKLQFSAFFTDVTHKHHLINALKGQAGFADAGTDIDSAPKTTMNTEQRLLSLFEQTNDAVFIIDLDGNCLETNKRASEMFGYSNEEMQTLSVQDLSSEPAESQSVIIKLLRGEKIPPYIRHFLKKNDIVFPAEINVQLVYSKTGDPLYIQSVVRDITHRYQEEEFMRTRDALLQKLSQQIPGAIYQYQFYPNGKYSFPYVSENIQDLFELSSQEAKKDASIVFSRMHADDHQMVMDSILDSYLSLTPWELEYRVVLPEKGTRWLSGIANPEKQIDGSVLWHGYTSDITERKTAEEALQKSEEKFRSLVNSLNDIVFTLDRELRYSGVFGNWIKTMDFTEETFLGKTSNEIFGEEKAAEHNRAAAEALNGKVITFEWQMLSGKETAYFQTTLSPIYNKEGLVTGLSGVGRNITSTKRAAELEKEIQLTRNTLEFKQKFLASMSHEIRTPLTGVLGITELLGNTPLDNTQKEFLHILKSSSENLREIIDQVLDYSRIEAGKVRLHIHDFPITTICSSAENLFRSMCRKPIAFHCAVDSALPDIIKADQKRITQVINNMLTNAIKYTEQGSISLDIRLHSWLDAEECLTEVCITDTGAGIEKSKFDNIFKAFSNVHSIDSANYEGAGLGLSICKELVELHGGTIGFDSEQGKGSRFWFTFKTRKAEERNIVKVAVNENPKKRSLKILFVEDKIMTQKIVKIMLENMGHSVSLANNGKEALDLVTPGMFDIVLMDIQMPVMDGITATRRLREKFPNGLPPIVGLSANNFEGDREKYMEEGLDDFISKPLKNENFQRITQIFSLNRE